MPIILGLTEQIFKENCWDAFRVFTIFIQDLSISNQIIWLLNEKFWLTVCVWGGNAYVHAWAAISGTNTNIITIMQSSSSCWRWGKENTWNCTKLELHLGPDRDSANCLALFAQLCTTELAYVFECVCVCVCIYFCKQIMLPTHVCDNNLINVCRGWLSEEEEDCSYYRVCLNCKWACPAFHMVINAQLVWSNCQSVCQSICLSISLSTLETVCSNHLRAYPLQHPV